MRTWCVQSISLSSWWTCIIMQWAHLITGKCSSGYTMVPWWLQDRQRICYRILTVFKIISHLTYLYATDQYVYVCVCVCDWTPFPIYPLLLVFLSSWRLMNYRLNRRCGAIFSFLFPETRSSPRLLIKCCSVFLHTPNINTSD